MKQAYSFFLFVGLMVAFAACSKKDDVAPDAGSTVAGTYVMNYIRYDSARVTQFALPLPLDTLGLKLSGSIIATRLGPTVDSLTVTLQQTGQSTESLPLGRFDVRTNGSSYDLYYGTQKIATSDGTTITIDTDPQALDAERYIFRGRK